MSNARIDLTVRAAPDTHYRADIIDPLSVYPEHGGMLSAGLVSGGLEIKFTYGYEPPAQIHAAIAKLRGALDQLDIDVDAAMERQAAATLPEGVLFAGTVGQFLDGITDQAPGELMEAFVK